MAWTKLKDIFATKKEINEVRDSLSQKTTIRTTQGVSLIQFDWAKRADGTLSLIVVVDGIKAIELLPSWPE